MQVPALVTRGVRVVRADEWGEDGEREGRAGVAVGVEGIVGWVVRGSVWMG